MNWLVFHMVSGQAFFTGIALILVALIASNSPKPFFKRITATAFVIGILGILISSTAIPYWLYACLSAAMMGWILSRYTKSLQRFATTVIVVALAIGVMFEVPYHVIPSVSRVSSKSVTIIGDSVTAGIGGDERSETWPNILAREHNLKVQDISHIGDTASSALKRIRTLGVESPVVVIEIGGNDLLGSTSSSKFALDLDELLATVSEQDRQIVMFELPLPPFCHEYGRIQRELARKHHVKLIPKRIFLSVVASGDSTLDSIHLSQTGHQKMANLVWRIIQLAYKAN